MGNNTSQFETGDILRFTSFPLHYAVYIGDGEIVHYNKRPDGNFFVAHVCIIKEKLTDYMKRQGTPHATLASNGIILISRPLSFQGTPSSDKFTSVQSDLQTVWNKKTSFRDQSEGSSIC